MKNHHEELRWQKDDEIEMKDEKNKTGPCGDLDGGFEEMAEEKFELRKRKDEDTWN